MATQTAQVLIDDLASDVRTILVVTESLKNKTMSELNRPAKDGGWSATQVLAHLNFYAGFYLPAIENALTKADRNIKTTYSSGWLGDYFTRLMAPKADGQVKSKMKSPKNAIPAFNLDAQFELDRFIAFQYQLLNVLEIARKVNMESVRIPTSLSSMVKLKLGDTFRFVIAHEQRHMEQIKRLFK